MRERGPTTALALLATIVIAGVVFVTIVSGPAAAADNATLNKTAPCYNNSTTVGNQSTWFPDGGNVSLDIIGQMSTRLGSYIIGTGEQIPGGTTYAGTLVMGLVMVGIILGAVSFTSVGWAGGGVVAATAGYGLVSVGLAPAWLRIVLLMIIGVLAAVAALRITR